MVSLIELLAVLLFVSFVNSYDPQTALTSVWLSGGAYCGKESYYSMNLGGPALGFKVNLALFDAKSDLQGYTGVLTDKKHQLLTRLLLILLDKISFQLALPLNFLVLHI